MLTAPPTRPIFAERAASFLARKLRENRTVLLSALLFGLLAHGFAFSNKLINHDEAGALFMKGSTVASGRWGLGLLDSVMPNYSMPWLYGLMSIALLAVAVCFLTATFSIRSRLLQSLLAGCVLTFPSLTGTFGYMFAAAPYALSFLLAVSAVWLLTRHGRWQTILAVGLLVGSVSIYQSYISIAAALLVLVLFQALLRGETAGRVLKVGIRYLCVLLFSLLVYAALTALSFRLTGTEFGTYAQDGLDFRLSLLPQRVALAYAMFADFFCQSLHGLIPTGLSRILHGVLAAVCLGLGLPLIRKRDIPSLALGAVLLALLPLAINCMYLVSAPTAIHTLVLYGAFTIYLVPILLAEAIDPEEKARFWSVCRTAAGNLLPAVLALIVTVNIYVANEAYLNLYLRYENAHAFYTSLISQLQQDPRFGADTRLAVIGDYTDPDFYEQHFSHTDRITGVHGFLPDSYSWNAFLTYYIGLEIPQASVEEVARIQATAEFEAMPCYPYYGSTKMFGDVFVVKLS